SSSVLLPTTSCRPASYPLSLHDALPISRSAPYIEPLMGWTGCDDTLSQVELTFPSAAAAVAYARRQGLRCLLQGADDPDTRPGRSEEHTSELQSRVDLVCRLLLEKKKA